jgi:hypothetical protein
VPACEIFLVARLFSDEHDRSVSGAFTEHRLCPDPVEVTCRAARGEVSQARKAGVIGYQVCGRGAHRSTIALRKARPISP